jgi:hypothetical protein
LDGPSVARDSDRIMTSPPGWRIAAAFIVAPLIAAATMACFEPLYDGLPSEAERIFKTWMIFCLFGAYPATILAGVPTFLFLRSRVRPTALNCTLAGGFVAAAPSLVLSILSGPDAAIDDGHVTVRHGHLTLWGWLLEAQVIGEIAAFGLLGGLVFWFIAAARSKSNASVSG